MDVTRIESNSLQLKKEEFDLKDLVVHAVKDYKNQLAASDSKIILVYEDENEKQKHAGKDNAKAVVLADKYRINQVISNLVNNSIKFAMEGGTISVIIRKTGDSINNNSAIIVSVKDTGTGIDPEIMPRLFSKFATKSDTGTGIGLGLFISKSIVEAHGGKIWAENNPDGKGATFSFSLPLLINNDNVS